jgi:Zn-finger domain-containing protein
MINVNVLRNLGNTSGWSYFVGGVNYWSVVAHELAHIRSQNARYRMIVDIENSRTRPCFKTIADAEAGKEAVLKRLSRAIASEYEKDAAHAQDGYGTPLESTVVDWVGPYPNPNH